MRISLRYRFKRDETIIVFIDAEAPDGLTRVTSWTPDRQPVSGLSSISEILSCSAPARMRDYPGGAAGLQKDLNLPALPENRMDWGERGSPDGAAGEGGSL